MSEYKAWTYRRVAVDRIEHSGMYSAYVFGRGQLLADSAAGMRELIRGATYAPGTIAEAFADGRIMRLADAKALGRAHGRAIAESVLIELGITCEADVLALEDGVYTVYDAINESEDGFRSYSPFEFYAAALNRRDDYLGDGESERGWAVYDEAFLRGCQAAYRAAGLGGVL